MKFTNSSEGVIRPTLPAEDRLGIEARNLRRWRARFGFGMFLILGGFFTADLALARFAGLPEGVASGLYLLSLACACGAAWVGKTLR
jgi:hypothetical protein